MGKVAVIGCGYVGKRMGELLERGHEVHKYDPHLLYHDKDTVNACELAVICVPTPSAPTGQCDTSIVREVASWIQCPLVLIKSTVEPGTTDALQRVYGGDDRHFHFSPEYMGEPRNFVPAWKYPDPRDASSHDFMIVGGPRASAVLDYFTPIMRSDARFHMCRAIEAELTKYMENSYFAAKVTFAYEWARIAHSFGVDYKILRELWLLDPRNDPGHTQVFPGEVGFGGKCLPKDLEAIVHACKRRGLLPELLATVLSVNREAHDARRQRDDRTGDDSGVSGSAGAVGSDAVQASQGANGQGRPNGYHGTHPFYR